jgi:hypothetical protein
VANRPFPSAFSSLYLSCLNTYNYSDTCPQTSPAVVGFASRQMPDGIALTCRDKQKG